MTLKKTNAATAKALRQLAKDYEETEQDAFSCNAIKHALKLPDVSEAYAKTFGFDGSTENDRRLWNQHDDEVLNDRILLLCFAAAMAETGDL